MRCLLSLLLVACTPAWPQDATRIELLSQVEVEGDRVLLGEVAHLRSDDLPMLRELVELPLGPAPRAGGAAVIRRATLMQWVRRRTGLDPSRVLWEGATETRVIRASQRIDGARVAEAAVAAGRAWLVDSGSVADVQVRRPPRDLDVPAGALRLQARRPELAAPRAHMHVWVDIFVADRIVRSVPVLLDAQGLMEGRLVPADRRVPMGVLDAARVPLAPMGVSRGDWAALHSAAGAVSMESRVEVLQDGRIGDKVRVRARSATGLVLARVVAPGQLELAP